MPGNEWNGWKWPDLLGMAGHGLKWLDSDGNGWKG